MMCGFPTLWNGGLVFDRTPTGIFQKFHHNALEVVNKYSTILQMQILEKLCILLFRIEITSYHKNPNFKNYFKIHQFTGKGIKGSSWAKLDLFAGQMWPMGHRLPMHA